MVSSASIGLLTILVLFLVVHFCVLLRIIPYDIVWGSRLKTHSQMIRFEIISIFLTILFILIVLTKMQVVNIIPKNTLPYIFWIMALIFALNIIGNISSKSNWERYLFSLLALMNLIFSVYLALN